MNWWILKRKVHVSWLIAIMCVGIFIGVFISKYLNLLPNQVKIFLCISVLLVGFSCWLKYLYLIPFILIGGLLFGLWRGALTQDELTNYEPIYGKSVTLGGSVKDDVDTGSAGLNVIRLNQINIKNIDFAGDIYVTANQSDIKRGDKLIIEGKLSKGFGNFVGVVYRAKVLKIIQPKPGDVARVIRDWFADSIRKVIPEPESSLGVGLLVGQRRSLPADLVVALQAVGLTHVVVASGYNLTILVRLARRLFEKTSKYLSALSSFIMIFSFIAITGLSPSMTRAGLVSSLCLMAWYYGRKFHPIILLLLAVAITVLFNPAYAWGDLGWQLSFAAFAGVMILAPLLSRYFFGDKKIGFVNQILIETVSAQILTAPIIIFSFGQFSNVAIIANILVLTFVPYAMLLVFIAGIVSLIFPLAIAGLLSMPAVWLLKYMIAVINYFASFSWAVSELQPKWWFVAVCYLTILGLCLYLWRATKYNLRDSNLVE